MIKVCAKAYYVVATGEVLCFTSEIEGDAIENTKERDMEIYPQLKNKNLNDIDFIELEYGTLATTVNNAKSYKINLDTKQLEVTYYTEEELETIKQQNQKEQELNNRVSNISSYLIDSDESTISNVEDTILEVESNKISEENGGI